jgi:RNA polymerase sigma-70 factor (ECF subfamily)
MSTLCSLSDSQREFAAEHHELVISFLRRRGLDMNEFYDVVVFGYLTAVQIYDQRPELRQYKFRTIANKRMHASLWNHYRSLYAAKRGETPLSLDAPYPDGVILSETVASPGNSVIEYAEIREKWREIQKKATLKQLQALILRADGYSGLEIGKVLHISPKTVSGRICRLRRKVLSAA